MLNPQGLLGDHEDDMEGMMFTIRKLGTQINRSFNESNEYVDKTADLPMVSELTTGSIAVRFKSSSTAVANTFLSASDTQAPSSNISFTMNNGTVYFENRENGAYATQISSSGTYNDGVWHTDVLLSKRDHWCLIQLATKKYMRV